MASGFDGPTPGNQPRRLEERVARGCRLQQYSIRTGDTYWMWTRQYILYHGKHHPKDMGELEVTQFLTHLAVDRDVAASTQAQALNAVGFFTSAPWGDRRAITPFDRFDSE